MAHGTRVWVRRTIHGRFGYNGAVYDRGQVFELAGLRNDATLLRVGYLVEVTARDHVTTPCRVCGGVFLTDAARTAHGDARHRGPAGEELEVAAHAHSTPPIAGKIEAFVEGRPVPDVMAGVDKTGDRAQELEEREAPLYLDQTSASRGVTHPEQPVEVHTRRPAPRRGRATATKARKATRATVTAGR